MMAFDFLPGEDSFNPSTTTSGGEFKVRNNYFIDKYQDHLEASRVISTPPKKNEFKLFENYNLAKNRTFNPEWIKEKNRNGAYGPKTDYKTLVDGYTQFQNPKLLDDSLKKVKDKIPEDLFSGLEKPKINFNDKFGIFSFDLASAMMTYVFDYYTKDGIKVDSNYVEKIDDQFIFTPSNQIVDQVIQRREDGTPVVISSVKKSYIDFQKQEKKDRSVEIIINTAFSAGEEAENVIFNSLAGVSIAENLEKRGFKVKITGLFSTYNNDTKESFYSFVPVKRFNQTLDKNAAAYVCGDPRYYRYQYFKLIFHAIDQQVFVVPGGLGRPLNNLDSISNVIEKEYVPNSSRKQADTRLYFGGSRSMEDVKQEVNQALKILNNKYGEEEET